MIEPTQLIADGIVKEARTIYKKTAGYKLKGTNSLSDAVVIYGAARILKPKIMCEIGVASGLSSVLMLEGVLRYGGEPTLYSYDLLDHLYYDDTKQVGFFLSEVAPHLKEYYRLRTCSYAAAFMDECESGLGLAYIDAQHMHPWAALDALVLLPAMDKGAYILLDAVSNYRGYTQGPFYLLHYWKGYKFVAPVFSASNKPTMTGFLEYDGDAEKAVDSALCAIGADWQKDVPDEYIEKVVQVVGNFVGEQYRHKLFDLMEERAKQYRHYADIHAHVQQKHFTLLENMRSETTALRSQLAARGRYMKGTRCVIHAISSFLGRNR